MTSKSSPSKKGSSAEARALSSELRSLVKSKDLTSKEVEFARQKLRRQYMGILFAASPKASSASQSRLLDVVNQMWMDTSHSFIHRYRQKVASMDKAIADLPAKSKQRSAPDLAADSNNRDEPPPVGPVARRRLIGTFRQFLAAEESFWADLLIRLIAVYNVHEASGCLDALGISSQPTVSERDSQSSVAINTQNGQIIHQQALLLCHRTLICFGDLARYRELYDDGPDGKSKIDKNWSRAAECYHQARMLVPDNGNPSNQLAVLASYTNDTLSSTYHYYRALCVIQEFPTARPNLELTFTKALNKAKPDMAPDPKQGDASSFQSEFVILQAQIFTRQAITEIDMQKEKVMLLFAGCLANRLLQSATIVKVICTCIASLFDIRLQGSKRTANAGDADAQKQSNLEQCVLNVTIDLLRVLMVETTVALDDRDGDQQVTDATAFNISPVLRRSLPALRIGSKWLLSQSVSKATVPNSFWESYARFVNVLSTRYPINLLPPILMASALEENIDMAGFAPLSHSMAMPPAVTRFQQAAHHAQKPNEEHLMRIADLLADAQLATASQLMPMHDVEGVLVVGLPAAAVANSALPAHSSLAAAIPSLANVTGIYGDVDMEEENDDFTEDDLLDLAMRAHSMNADEAEDDDEILYPYSNSPRPSSLEVEQAGQTASDLLLQVLNGPAAATTNQSPVRSPRVIPRSISSSSSHSSPQIMSSSIGQLNPTAASIWNQNAKPLPPPATFGAASIWNAAPARPEVQQTWQNVDSFPNSFAPRTTG